MDHMFKNANVGKTIKSAAGWVFAVECFLSIFGGIWLIVYGILDDAETVGYGLLSLVVGPFVAWLSALILYGFGEIVDTAIANRLNSDGEANIVSEAKPKSTLNSYFSSYKSTKTAPSKTADTSGPAEWTCTCGKVNPPYMSSCSCGKTAREIREMNKPQ